MNQRLFPMLSALAIASTLLLGGCHRHPDMATAQTAQLAPAHDPQAEAAMPDAALTTTTAAELARDAELDPNKIDVEIAQGRVVLRGLAPDDDAKERAKRIAMAIEGVRGVDNYLKVRRAS